MEADQLGRSLVEPDRPGCANLIERRLGGVDEMVGLVLENVKQLVRDDFLGGRGASLPGRRGPVEEDSSAGAALSRGIARGIKAGGGGHAVSGVTVETALLGGEPVGVGRGEDTNLVQCETDEAVFVLGCEGDVALDQLLVARRHAGTEREGLVRRRRRVEVDRRWRLLRRRTVVAGFLQTQGLQLRLLTLDERSSQLGALVRLEVAGSVLRHPSCICIGGGLVMRLLGCRARRRAGGQADPCAPENADQQERRNYEHQNAPPDCRR